MLDAHTIPDATLGLPEQPPFNLRLPQPGATTSLFYFHFHPEYELTLIEAASGTTFIGNTAFPSSDPALLLIGPNTLHRRQFDPPGETDGTRTVCFSVTVLLRESLGYDVLGKDELAALRGLLHRAERGIVCLDIKKEYYYDACMRTTMTVDDDLMIKIKKKAGNEGLSMKDVVNEALRYGIDKVGKAELESYACPTYSLGVPRGVDLNHSLELFDALHDEEITRKLELNK